VPAWARGAGRGRRPGTWAEVGLRARPRVGRNLARHVRQVTRESGARRVQRGRMRSNLSRGRWRASAWIPGRERRRGRSGRLPAARSRHASGCTPWRLTGCEPAPSTATPCAVDSGPRGAISLPDCTSCAPAAGQPDELPMADQDATTGPG
jgi:hypothetical protein